MNFEEKHTTDDEKFVRAASNYKDCSAQIERLSRQRNILLKISVCLCGLFLFNLLMILIQSMSSKTPPSYLYLCTSIILLTSNQITYHSIDVQIKFLKVAQANFAPEQASPE